ncbi:hypothetical protein ACO22_06882 [Paracoccidioides brasiliensis]|uniref:Uncharacterized protein n=1 Tax=Paracoccidioides brasiliensis TaxID=121759 RepID=A0A1D2J691_PARBR|nr:hypothetical protein ACO22_06882 [Paracoccidioides brasiliensis]ODH49610.1 hypothetical protein GX48_04263 [Paracoccidioides brasiliensis]
MGVTPQSSTRGSRPPVCSLESVNHSRLLSQEPREVQKLLRCCQSSRFFYLDLQDIDGRRVVGDKERNCDRQRRGFSIVRFRTRWVLDTSLQKQKKLLQKTHNA